MTRFLITGFCDLPDVVQIELLAELLLFVMAVCTWRIINIYVLRQTRFAGTSSAIIETVA